jgi:predicted DNA-binding helix-hairpin-helix protein
MARGSREGVLTDAKGRALPVYYAAGPGGRTFPLLKTMLTTACERDCYYCPFRAGRDSRRATFTPDEMAKTFIEVHRAGIVEGLFLSTGILKGGPNTQNRLLDTAEILRRRLRFDGYLHLKLMPGAEHGQIERAMQLASRVSINLEAPSAARLERLAPHKSFATELLEPLTWTAHVRADSERRLASSATQFVVGAADETDLELLQMTSHLFKAVGLERVFYSAFDPCPGTPLEGSPAEEPLREHRLYQASYLLRDYGFDLEELPFESGGNLPINRDPKQAYAEAHLTGSPVEVNRAPPERLRRVPGIGPLGVRRILSARRERTLHDLAQLRRMGIVADRAAPYITLDGRRPPRQLSLGE